MGGQADDQPQLLRAHRARARRIGARNTLLVNDLVRGLTADELCICAALSAAAGIALGVPLAWLTSALAIAPTVIVVAIGAASSSATASFVARNADGPRPGCTGSSSGGSPFTIQASRLTRVASRWVTRSGYWTIRRSVR